MNTNRFVSALNKPVTVLSLLYLGLCTILIQRLGMPFTLSTKLALYVLTLLSTQLWPTTLAVLKPYVVKRRQVVLLSAFCLYAAFAFSGSELLLYPLTKGVGLSALLKFILTALWMAPLCLGGLSLFLRLGVRSTPASPKQQRRLYWLCAALVLAVGAIYVVGFNPAISSYDTVDQFRQAKGASPLVNWHSPFHTLFLRLLLWVADSPSVVTLVHCAYFALVWASGMLFLHRQGLSRAFALAATAIFMFFPNNAQHLITLWKDIPYATTLLWLTILLARLILTPDTVKHSWLYSAQLCAALTFCFLLRQNGVVPFLVTLIAISVLARHFPKILMAAGVSIVCVLVISGPVYKALDVQDGPKGGLYIGLGQDILGVHYGGGNLSQGALDIVETLSSPEGFHYTPYWAASSYHLDLPLGNFIAAYLSTFVKNPALMTRAILCRVDGAWNLFGNEDSKMHLTNYIGTADSAPAWTALYPPRATNKVTTTLVWLGDMSVRLQLSDVLLWRVGFSTLLLLGCGVTVLLRRTPILLWAAVPWLGQFLSLLLSTGWMDYRYYWPLWIMSFFLLALLSTGNTDLHKK